MDDELLTEAMRAYGRAIAVADPIRLRFWDGRGLTMPQLRLMYLLLQQDGRPVGELADEMNVRPATVTGLTDRLVRQRLIKRQDDPNDRRVVRVALTAEGRRVLGEIESAGRAYMAEILARMDGAAVRRLIDDDGSVGLVIFSDLAYELLPPGTPASELRPLLRYLVPRRATRVDAGLPVNPWSESFSAGTRISSALELARDMLVRDRVKNGSILLLSDLVTAPEDVPELARTLHALRQSITIRVVPLRPLKAGRTVFEELLGRSALIAPSQLRNPQRVSTKSEVELPAGFLVLGGFLLAVLAAHERFAGRLVLPRARRRHA